MNGITIHTDGGSRGNPGPAGAGWIIEHDGKTKKNAKFLGQQTNNWAEYEAVILALTDLKRLVSKDKRSEVEIEIKMDSELVTSQLRHEYQIKEESLQPQFIKLHNMRVAHFPNITFTHIPREQNNIADGLANEAMDSGTGTLL